MDKQLNVGIADMKITRNEGVLITYALGSCIGIALYDPVIKLGALVHIMLPTANVAGVDNPYKYADTGIRETIRRMSTFGAVPSRIVAKIAGGAKMFELKGGGNLGNIGQRNEESVKIILRQEGIRLLGDDTGANYARTMLFDVSKGSVIIRTYGRQELTF